LQIEDCRLQNLIYNLQSTIYNLQSTMDQRMPKQAPQHLDFLSPVSLCDGIGPKRGAALRESGIETVGDLLNHFPRRYIERSTIIPLGSIGSFIKTTCTVSGTIEKVHVERGRRGRLRALLSDGTGSIELLWFAGVPVFRNLVKPGNRFLVTGKIGHYIHFQMVHPIIERLHESKEFDHASSLPFYPITEAMREAGINHRSLSKVIGWALDHCTHFPNPLPLAVEKKRSFPPLETCLRQIHRPETIDKLERYTARLRYEELYRIALTLRWSRREFALPGRSMHPCGLDSGFRSTLPFSLTEDQEKAITVLYADAASKHRMHRLLQGDVGSGKTLVAFFACLPALASGLQVAWLAPTEVLALQTFHLIEQWLATLGMNASLCRGGMNQADRANLCSGLAAGTVRFVVGTHALLQPDIRFKHLGMIVIDEQHKFGVEQRLALHEKDKASDLLLMSATPIPQTLAQTLYGDLEVVTIEKPPKGRLPVATHLVPDLKRVDMERFVRTMIEKENAAAYWVVPRIEKDDAEDVVKDAGTTFESLSHGSMHGIPMACLHGRLAIEEKERIVRQFIEGSVQLLVSTTVIEVGIDIPRATSMVIENAERFGLAQLHQLRGRVGRGGAKAWCFLLSPLANDPDTAQRLSYFCAHSDGFKIADKDLELRGPGEVGGFRQSGWEDLKMADIVRDAPLFREIQAEIEHHLPMVDPQTKPDR
jgi:ATP-dependent DNA helicase RecG